MNAHWFSSMASGKIILSLLARTLEITLYKKLQQAMGLYSSIVRAFVVLGTRERMVELTPVGIKPKRKKDCTATMNSLPIIGQAATKNCLVKPSGPDTLPLGRVGRAWYISCTVTGPTRPAAVSLEHRYVNKFCREATEISSNVASWLCKKV